MSNLDCQFDKTWEEGTSVEGLSPEEWPVRMSVEFFLDWLINIGGPSPPGTTSSLGAIRKVVNYEIEIESVSTVAP